MGKTILAYLVSAILIASSFAFGQSKVIDDSDEALGFANKIAQPAIRNVNALEGPINADEYIIGPSDILEYRVWGYYEEVFTVQVGPDGLISVPTIGLVEVGNISLTEAEIICQKRALELFPKAKITLRLISVRMIKVSISGAVNNPGLYSVYATDRLSYLFNISGGVIDPERSTKEEDELTSKQTRKEDNEDDERYKVKKNYPSLRHVQLTKRIGKRSKIDYLHFVKNGNLDYNPVLADGDMIQVPFRDEENGVVSIFGAVRSPERFEFVEGDHLSDIVDLSGGFKPDAFKDAIEIVRFHNGIFDKKLVVNVNVASGGSENPEIRADDRIFVRSIPDYNLQYLVKISGEVKYPGYYPIIQDSTKLTELIDACGGFNYKANLPSASIVRRAAAEIQDPEYERLKMMAVAEMNEMEYEYFKTRSRTEAPTVVVDFVKLFKDHDASQDVVLRDRDEIEIPEISPTVNVTGQVNRPGFVHWVPGKSIDYYIDKAGGYSWNARKGKLRLIKAYTGKWVKPRGKTIVEVGDTIFVPEKQEIAYWELWKDILLVVSQMATILLVVRTAA